MKKKASIVVAILLLAVGFAAISTTLIINGDTKVSENTDDFSVIFSAAILDGEDVYNEVINDTKQTINFSTSELKTKNQTSILNYEVTNNSSNYDAEITVNCKIKDNAEAKYTSIKNELEGNAAIVKAKEKLNGTLTVTLEKTATEEVREEYVCELTFNAVERDTLGRIYSGPTKWAFDFTGEEQIFTVPISGTYKIETWGAQGGNNGQSITTKFAYTKDYLGGYGGYSTGNIKLSNGKELFINVGGKGESNNNIRTGSTSGGYNGGGIAGSCTLDVKYGVMYIASGGGATHVATNSGVLSSLENSKSNIIIVSGGGGGGFYHDNHTYNSFGNGGNAGGYIGNDGQINNTSYSKGFGGTQTNYGTESNPSVLTKYTAAGFGFGANGITSNQPSCGGGSGFYGGGPGLFAGCGGGSGYIGNSLLTDKSMYCYNCQESTDESTKTISTTCTSATPTENCAKIGNGYARITLISK